MGIVVLDGVRAEMAIIGRSFQARNARLQAGGGGAAGEGRKRGRCGDHRAIIEAILAGDGPGAEQAMRRHLEARCEVILSLPARVFGG